MCRSCPSETAATYRREQSSPLPAFIGDKPRFAWLIALTNFVATSFWMLKSEMMTANVAWLETEPFLSNSNVTNLPKALFRIVKVWPSRDPTRPAAGRRDLEREVVRDVDDRIARYRHAIGVKLKGHDAVAIVDGECLAVAQTGLARMGFD